MIFFQFNEMQSIAKLIDIHRLNMNIQFSDVFNFIFIAKADGNKLILSQMDYYEKLMT